MAKTVIGLFDNTREAQRAVVELINSGIPRDDIGITSQNQTTGEHRGYDNSAGTADAGDEGFGEKISNFFSSLFGGSNAEDSSRYADAVRRGGTAVTVDADSDDVANRAAAIMDRLGADVDERGTQYEAGSYTGSASTTSASTTSASTTAVGGMDASSSGRDMRHADLSEGGEATLPVVEEELNIGKREVDRGGVRVRSRVIERPVEETVRLREERVNVDRHPVNRPVTDADLQAFREGTIEVTARAEEALVDKQARVVEEVVVNKDVTERDETIRDTVRRTDVEVDEGAADDTVRARRAPGE